MKLAVVKGWTPLVLDAILWSCRYSFRVSVISSKGVDSFNGQNFLSIDTLATGLMSTFFDDVYRSCKKGSIDERAVLKWNGI